MANRSTPDPDTQRDLYAEADARFWGSIGYRPGQKLDPKNPIDARMIPVYVDLYAKLYKQWQAERPAADSNFWTFKHPVVVAAIADAHAATAQTAASMDAAATAAQAGDAKAVTDHVNTAQTSHAAAQVATQAAAQVQAQAPGPTAASKPQTQKSAHDVQQFVMSGAGMGVPVVSHGSDAAAVMQANAAPGHLPDPSGTSLIPKFPPIDDTSKAIDRQAAFFEKKITVNKIAIGAAAVAAVGLLVWGISSGGGSASPRARTRKAP